MKKLLCCLLTIVLLLVCSSCSLFTFSSRTPDDDSILDEYFEKYLEKQSVAINPHFTIDGAMFAYVVYDYVNQYGSYLSSYGYNASLGLLNQTTTYKSGSSSQTWYAYFCGLAESRLAETVSLASQAKKEGMTLSDEDIKEIDESMKELEEYALKSGYGGINKFLGAAYIPGVTAGAVRRIMEMEALAYSYYEKYIDSLSYTYDELLNYCEKNSDSIDIVTNNYFSKDVRHILFSVDTSLTGSALENAFTKAKEEADKILAEYNNGDKTADAFGALAKEHTDDSNGEDGGLYEKVLKGQMVDEFENWIYDETREAGNVDLIKTKYGWHIMYFVGDNMTAWQVTAEEGLKSDDYEEHLEELKEQFELEYDYEAMFVSLGGEL